MTSKTKYDKVHRLAKLIVCIVNTLLLVLYAQTDIIAVLICLNILYFFGVNTVAYVLESIFNFNHNHERL